MTTGLGRDLMLEQRIRASTDQRAARQLANELDYLPGDAATKVKLSLFLHPKTFYPFGIDVGRGLWIARNRPMVVAALEKAITDPAQSNGAGSGLLGTLVALKASLEVPYDAKQSATQLPTKRITAEYAHQIAMSIPARTGESKIDAARTVFVAMVNAGNTSSPDFDIAREAIITHFGEVNEYIVDWMLNAYGKYLRDPRMIPALHRILENTTDPILTGERAAAITQLAEIAPGDMPTYLIREACAEHPVMLRTVRDLTPVDTLPATDACLKEKLRVEASAVSRPLQLQLGTTMGYIARFADDALVPDVRRAYGARTEDWDQSARGAAVTYLMRWDAKNSRPLLEEFLPAHDSSGGAMMYFLLDPAHVPDDGLREALRGCLEKDSSKVAEQCGYGLSQIGEPEDQKALERRLELLRKHDVPSFSPEDGKLEGELVAALLKGRSWNSTEQQTDALQHSCISSECKQRFHVQ